MQEVADRGRKDRADRKALAGGGGGDGVELQPHANAPLLRTDKQRREWIEHELDECNQARCF